MTMIIPTIPIMAAGYVATATDMNNLAYAAQFMLTKPIARVHDTVGTQAIGTGTTTITWGAADFDPDGMWNSGSPTQLTIQTPGFYKMSYMLSGGTVSTTIDWNASAHVTTGANNPAGAGVVSEMWPGYGSGSASANRVTCRASGIIPWYLYALDYVWVGALAASTGITLNTASFPSYLCLELVSI